MFLRRLLKDDAMADDIAQEVFWIAYRKLDQFKGENWWSWLYTIAYRLALKELKKRKREEDSLNNEAEVAELICGGIFGELRTILVVR